MICKNCNAEIDNSSAFCINCGTPVENEPVQPHPVYQPPYQPQPEQPVYQPQPEQPVYQQQPYQQPYQQQYQPQGYQQPYQQQGGYQQQYQPQQYQPQTYTDPEPVAEEKTEPVTKIGSYIGWFLLSAFSFLLIPFIVMIVFAVDGSNKNRANFFRAQFALAGILIAVVIVLFLVLLAISAIFGISLMGF